MTIQKNLDGIQPISGITGSSAVMTEIRNANEVIIITSNDGSRAGNYFHFYAQNKGAKTLNNFYITENLDYYEGIALQINFNSGGVISGIYRVGKGWSSKESFQAQYIEKIYVR